MAPPLRRHPKPLPGPASREPVTHAQMVKMVTELALVLALVALQAARGYRRRARRLRARRDGLWHDRAPEGGTRCLRLFQLVTPAGIKLSMTA
mmetsp:Transcript_907/g.2865  ORF Transcript_907/g.2865 Transcript_907/m.2865 type:complete len:93 (+) Transcript_907:1809-2087(+)